MKPHELDCGAPHYRGAWMYAGACARHRHWERSAPVYATRVHRGYGWLGCGRALGVLNESTSATRDARFAALFTPRAPRADRTAVPQFLKVSHS